MTNAELINGLRWCADESICCDDFSGEKCPYFDEKKDSCSVDEILHAAADALEAADKRIAEFEAQMPKEGEWITADNPPKNEGLYLVGLSVGWDNEYVVRLARYTKDISEALFSSKLSGDGWYRWDGDNDCDVICHPKYWMELPEPPNCGAKMQTVTDCHTLVESER